MITRRKLAKKYEGVIHAVGLILLLLLMLLVTFKDIWQLIVR
jgi:membrane-associated protease RseP (regulator of RpoE activity)